MPDEIKKYLCNRCCQDTRHELIHTKVLDKKELGGSASWKLIVVVSCFGCKEYTIVEEEWWSDYLPEEGYAGEITKLTYKPPRSWHKPPEWLAQLEDIDLKNLLDEVYSATNSEQIRLLSMGVRAVLDRVMTLILGGDIGGFEQKLEEMVKNNHITKEQAENIKIVIDAGSASTHRAFRPPLALIKEMVVVMESIVRTHYITAPMLKTAKQSIPPRPPRKLKATNPGR